MNGVVVGVVMMKYLLLLTRKTILCSSICLLTGMMKLLASLETGPRVRETGYGSTAEVLAFRLETDPDQSPGIMTVDGESIDYGSLQAQVLPSMARVMSIKRENNE